MARGNFAESTVEQAALDWLQNLGYAVKHGSDIAPGELAAERTDYGQVIFPDQLRQALVRLNPELPPEALGRGLPQAHADVDAAVARWNGTARSTGCLVDGVNVEYRRKDGSIAGAQARVTRFRRARE
jgi:type I restriction enzyme R subunit